MNEDEFTKLFKYMEKRFDAIETELVKKSNTDDMNHRFDQVIGALDDLLTEHAALASQVDRHDALIHQLSAHTNLKLANDNQR
jgi:hypothetical protein